MSVQKTDPQFLTTHEVAELLRVKERKVYELAAAGDIPCRRVTGKLLFPRAEVEDWLAGGASRGEAGEAAQRPSVVAGSHDPLLEWALRESGSGLATIFDGSLDGLERLAGGQAIACGMHVLEPTTGEWNRAHLDAALAGKPFAAIEWARRRQGLIIAPQVHRAISGLSDLEGARVLLRQPNSGGRILFDHLLAQAGLDVGDLVVCTSVARTETEVAALLASGEADAALGLETVAHQFRLGFAPLIEERYDLVVHWGAYFRPPFQALLGFAREASFAARAAAMGGYDVAGLGTVRWSA